MILYNPIGFYTLFKRETMRYMKIAGQTVLAPLITNLLFLSIFGALFRGRDIGIPDTTYLQFLVPGLAAMGAIMNAIQNPSSSMIIQKYSNIIEDLNTFPITVHEKVAAFVLAGTFRGLLIGTLTYVATIPFAGATITHPILFFIVLFIISMIFSSIGLILGLLINSFDKLSFFLNIILTPLVYFGGVFFQISTLPSILPTVAYLNPIFPLVDTLRWTYIEHSDGNLLLNVSCILVFCVIVYGSCTVIFKKGYGLKH